MAWNAPGGGNDSKDPWKDDKSSSGDFEQRVNSVLERFSGGGGINPTGLIIILLVIIGLWFAAGFYLIDEKERGVVLRFGKYLETVTPGLHWNPKFVDTVDIVNVTQVTPFSDKVTMLTEDDNIVNVKLSVQYRIANPENYLLEIKDPRDSLAQSAEAALRHVVGTSKMDRILTVGKQEVAQDTKALLREYMERYKTGIEIDAINIEDAQPPEEVKAAFEDVVKAIEDKQSTINQAESYRNGLLPEARGEAHSRLENAEGYKQGLIAEARGEAQRFVSLLGEYQQAPQVTRKRLYLETIEDVMQRSTKVMIDVKDGNNMLYLPLDKVLEHKNKAPREYNSRQSNTSNNRGQTSSGATQVDTSSRSSRVREQR